MESAQEWFERVSATVSADGYRAAPWQEWPTWPFTPDGAVRDLARPVEERPREGAGGAGCHQCRLRDDPSYIFWHDDLAMLGEPFEATSLPLTAFLMPRRHADLSDLTDAEAARMGQLLTVVERAVCDVLDVPRMQVYRYGDGVEHLHWWLLARPTGVAQLRGSFLPLWDDLLPTRDAAARRHEMDAVAARLVALAGGTATPAP